VNCNTTSLLLYFTYLLTYYNKDRASVRVRIGYRGRCSGKGGGQVSFILREIHWHFETDGYRRSHISASQSQLGHGRRRRDYAVICPLICPQPRTSAPWLGFKVIGNESVPIQLAQCWFPGLAASNAEIIYGSNFIKQHSETVMVWNYQNADCSLRKKFIVLFIITFGTLSFPITLLFVGLLGLIRVGDNG